MQTWDPCFSEENRGESVFDLERDETCVGLRSKCDERFGRVPTITKRLDLDPRGTVCGGHAGCEGKGGRSAVAAQEGYVTGVHARKAAWNRGRGVTCIVQCTM